jgi:hypothetical protein
LKPRWLFVNLFIWSLGAAATAQSASVPGADPTLIAPEWTLHVSGDGPRPNGQPFMLVSNAEGESSSLALAGTVAPNSLFVPPAPTMAVATAIETPCDRPAELFDASEYDGPLKRIAAWFARNPEMTTVPARRKKGQKICGLNAGQKFDMFVETSIDPVTFIGAAASAGFSQWQNDDSKWGQGSAAYGKRYAAALTDTEASNFFGQFFYPVIFRQDPRYYRKGNGTTRGRIGYAMSHTFVARSDSGSKMPNYSLWATTASTVALSNLYHPGNDQGFPPAATRVGISIAGSMGYDLLREFWPEVVHKLRLPFRERSVISAAPYAKP